MLSAEHIHPITVHFVIAPLFIAIVFDVLWFMKRKELFEQISYYNLIIAGIFGIISVMTGLIAEEEVTFSELSKNTFESHENSAFIFIILLLIQVLWRIGLKGKIPTKLIFIYYSIITLNIIAVVFTGYNGGKLVFKYGIGVESQIGIKKENNPIKEKKTPKIQFVKPDSSN